MEAKAILRNARIAPRKVQIVLDLIRGKDYDVAMATVKHTPKAASEYLEKLLKSAAHNAENNHNMDKNNLGSSPRRTWRRAATSPTTRFQAMPYTATLPISTIPTGSTGRR